MYVGLQDSIWFRDSVSICTFILDWLFPCLRCPPCWFVTQPVSTHLRASWTRKLQVCWRSPLVHSLTPRKWFWIVLKSCFLVIEICISMGLRFVLWCQCPSSMSGLSWRVRSRSVWNTAQLSPNKCGGQATCCHRVSILSRASGFSLC